MIQSIFIKKIFKADKSQIEVVYSNNNLDKRIFLVGFGVFEKCSPLIFQEVFGNLSRKLSQLESNDITIFLNDFDKLTYDYVSLFSEAMILGQNKLDLLKTNKSNNPFTATIDVFVSEKSKSTEDELASGIATAEGIILARYVANLPANILTPGHFVEIAKKQFKGTTINLEVLTEKDAKQLGMGAFLGVSQGSDEPGYILVLRNNLSVDPKVALVGKGVTFDSGGVSIKPSKGMSEMKGDMGGAAAVLGAFASFQKLSVSKSVLGVIPLVENMCSSKAQRPGDVVTSMSGKTIEVLNTDAEGRLILADSITYANSQNVETIIDVATLTGACVVALGNGAAGLFSNDETLSKLLLERSKQNAERLWELPLFDEYLSLLDSEIADIANCYEGRLAGAITAAKFLEQFVDNKKWAHLDIAGMMSASKTNGIYQKGMTGFGVKTLVDFVQN